MSRAQGICNNGGMYLLGTGDYRPHPMVGGGLVDVPWTAYSTGTGAQAFGSDCAGFAICWAWKLVRHRPGFNRGRWSTIEDDLNCNSAIEDANHKQELFTEVDTPRPGDFLAYPSFYLRLNDGTRHQFIGHVGLVSSVPSVWDPKHRNYRGCGIIQCHGPNGFKPGVVATDGSIWQQHDVVWPKSEHCTHIIRPKERV